MVIWPKQLQAINELVTAKGFNAIDLVALPLCIQATINYSDGSHQIILLDHDGIPRRDISEIFGL